MRELLDGFDTDQFWTTQNAREAWPGVTTPLNWSFYGETAEEVIRATFFTLGALRSPAVPADVAQRFTGVFNGRAAFNVDAWRAVADATPGNSGNALERQFFGRVRPGVENRPDRKRYPVAAVKTPKAALTVGKQVRRHRRESEVWWRQSIAEIEAGDLVVARAKLRQGPRKFVEVSTPHMVYSMLAQALFQQIADLTEKAGHPGLEAKLATGYGSERPRPCRSCGTSPTAADRTLWSR